MSLLYELRLEFRRCAKGSSTASSSTNIFFKKSQEAIPELSAETLARRWLRLAEVDRVSRGQGHLTALDEQAIALRVAQAFGDFDLAGRGRVHEEEWVHGCHLLPSSRIQAQIAAPLFTAISSRPRALTDLQEMFEKADESGTGRLSFKNIQEMYRKGAFHVSPKENRVLSQVEIQLMGADRLARDCIEAMDVDGDGHVNYGEFLAFCAGRRKTPVYLYMYDLSKGLAQLLSPWLSLEHIWHSGVVAFGKEYFFAKDAVWDHPGKTDFGEPTKEVFIGYTLWSKVELHSFICNELKPVFHRDTYDSIGNNCNHFADRLCLWLTGSHVPEEVLLQTEKLMQMSAVRVLRPALNRALRDHVAARATPPPSEDAPASDTSSPQLGPKKRDQQPDKVRLPYRTDEEVPVGSVVAVQEAWGFSLGTFGVVCEPPTTPLPIAARTSKPLVECQGCSMPAFAACCRPIDAKAQIQDQEDNLFDHRPQVWVRYFEVVPPSSTTMDWAGHIRIEAFSRDRLARVLPEESVKLPCYTVAASCIAQSPQICRSSRQASQNVCQSHYSDSGPRASRGSMGRPVGGGLEAMRPRSVHEPEEDDGTLEWAHSPVDSDDHVYLM